MKFLIGAHDDTLIRRHDVIGTHASGGKEKAKSMSSSAYEGVIDNMRH